MSSYFAWTSSYFNIASSRFFSAEIFAETIEFSKAYKSISRSKDSLRTILFSSEFFSFTEASTPHMYLLESSPVPHKLFQTFGDTNFRYPV